MHHHHELMLPLPTLVATATPPVVVPTIVVPLAVLVAAPPLGLGFPLGRRLLFRGRLRGRGRGVAALAILGEAQGVLCYIRGRLGFSWC